MSMTAGKLTFLFCCYFSICVRAYLHSSRSFLYRVRSGQPQNGIYDTRDRDKPYKDSAQL